MSSFGTPISASLRDAIGAISPRRVAVFLREQNWEQGQPWREKGHDWINPEGEHILVPSDPSVRFYAESLMSLLEMFVGPQVKFEDAMVMAQFGTSDIIRRRIDEPSTYTGTCGLDEARAEMVGLKELLLWSSRRYAQRLAASNELATSYFTRCRAGQTELGSYVLKVYAPLGLGQGPDQQSVGREITMAVMDNVTYFAGEQYTPEAPLPPAMDWHVAESILRMRSSAGFWGENNERSIRFVESVITKRDPSLVMESRGPETSIKLTGEVFDRAEAVYEALRTGEMFERRTFTGHITDLHKDEPSAKTQNQRITIRTTLDGRTRSIAMQLLPVDYRRAVVWHDKEHLVRVDAKIDKRWRTWTAPEYHSIEALVPQENQDTLFRGE